MQQLTQHRKRRNKSYRRLTAALLSGVVAITSCLAGTDLAHAAGTENTELQNPRVEMNTCDTVYFGSYWQEDTNGDGVADQNDDKTPIRWRILSRNGNDAYVMADQVLDCKPYHETDESVTWETSTLRKWLNEEFYNTAFTAAEQEAVLEQTLVNEDNEEYGTEGGADTVDQVYLPSVADMENGSYGFQTNAYFDDQARIGKATGYAEEQGAYATGEKGSSWWLRSPGVNAADAAYVGASGSSVWSHSVSSNGYVYSFGVRPALHLNLSSPLVYQGGRMEVSLKYAAWDLVELGTYEGKTLTWRVLQISGNDLFLLSDQILTNQEYHESYEDITWKDSTLRAWLNGEFFQETFTGEEQAGILPHLYENLDNPWYGTEGGEDTRDNICLLSLEDIINPAYGFPTDYYCEHSARIAHGLEDDRGSWQGGRLWWLRSPGNLYAVYVHFLGYVEMDIHGSYVYGNGLGVRPALHFDISTYPLTKVGTVTAEAEKEYREDISGRPITTEKPGTTEEPETTEKPDTTQQPDVVNQPDTTQKPESSSKPNTTNTPSASNSPENTETPSGSTPSVTPSGSGSTDSPGTAETPSISGSSQGSIKNQATKLNIKNKKKYPLSKKLTIRDTDGIRSVKLNGKNIKIKAGKKSISFKLSKYKKKLKKKGKWNRLVIIDQKGKKTMVKFKIK